MYSMNTLTSRCYGVDILIAILCPEGFQLLWEEGFCTELALSMESVLVDLKYYWHENNYIFLYE